MIRTAAGRRWAAMGITVILAAGLGACVDSGLPDRNLPKAEAERRTYGYPVYQPLGAALTEVWELNGRRWQLSAAVENLAQTQLRNVANANGTAMYALAWDQEPFERLYTPVGEDRWRVVVAID